MLTSSTVTADSIHIAVTFDSNYALPLAAMLQSLVTCLDPQRDIVLHAFGYQIPALRARRRRSQQRRTVDDKDLLTGGVPPVAQGFLASDTERRIAGWYSSLANAYWRLVRNRIG